MEMGRVAIGRKQGGGAERGEPAVDPRAALMRQLQQGAGNASVTRMLARLEDDVPSGPTEIEPHGPGDDKDTPGVLAEAAQQPDEGGIMGLLAAVGGAIASGAAPEAPAAVAAPAGHISKSVGRGGANLPADVKVVGDLLGAVGMAPAGDDLGPAITRYQADALGWPQQDGRADPGGKTITALV